jgi:UDPglucose 6-dehydrogenase
LLTAADDPYVAAKDAEAIVILTEWPDFRVLDWSRIAAAVRQPIIVDTRNLLDPDVMRRAKLEWTGVGRSAGRRQSALSDDPMGSLHRDRPVARTAQS